MKMLATALLLQLLFVKTAASQTSYMDGLKKSLLSNSIQDTQRISLLADLAYATAFISPDSAMFYAQQGIALARKIDFVKGEMRCRYSIGGTMWIVGDYLKANELLLQVLKYAKSINDIMWQVGIYRALSANNRDQGAYAEALRCSYAATELAESSKQSINEVGLCYLENGANYEATNQYDSALYYLQKVSLPTEPDSASGYNGFKFLKIGNTYDKMEDKALALKYYTLSIRVLTGSNNYKDFATAYNSISKLYKKEGKIDSCIYYAMKGFDIAQKGSFKKGIYETSLLLSEIYEKKDASVALNYYKTATAAKDSMFNLQKTMQFLNAQFDEQTRQQQEESNKIHYQNKVRTYTLLAVLSVFLLLAIILYRNNRQKQKAKLKIEKAYTDLKSAQTQLIQSEKLASLGELTAGIAHEIQNPLNFVNNFSEVSNELLVEMVDEVDKGNITEVKAIAENLKQNLEKINHHGKRADAIVKGMLQHSQANKGQKDLTDINGLADEYLRLSYHGLRSKDKSFNATIKTDFDTTLRKINIIPQDIGRVLLNLYNNAFYAVNGKEKNEEYQPTVLVTTKKHSNNVTITVADNGNGIPKNIIDKIFQPFFTTKPTGQGTGLGLSLSYDIVKAHGGEIKVETKEGEGTSFIIQLPVV